MQSRLTTLFTGSLVIIGLGCASEMPTAGSVAEGAADAALRLEGQSARIPDRFIVVFRDEVADVDAEVTRALRGSGGQEHYRYRAAIKGFAATIPAAALEALWRNPSVSYIEPDQMVSLSATQSGATWGLDRIDQRALPLSTSFTYTNTGAGVSAYIIDTGILTGHTEFGGRASAGIDVIGGKRGNSSDCNGHGTHVAGTVGGRTYGVAKAVKLIAVRVLDCRGSGTNSGVIAGVDWVRANANKPAVANMSLGGGASTAVDQAVAAAVSAGITFVVAAGNETADACTKLPARAPSAITVGATSSADARATYSNFGTCVDIFAPGSSITSAWFSSTTALNTISGTSMASPHVAGVAALYLQSNPTSSPAAVASALTAGATQGAVKDAGTGSPNLLLFTAY